MSEQQKQKYTDRTKVCGLWKRTTKSDPAKTYLGGTDKDGAVYSVFPNGYKQPGQDSKPDYQLYVAWPIPQDGETAEAAPQKTEDFGF